MARIEIKVGKGDCTGFLTRYCRLPEGHEGYCSFRTSTLEQLEGQLGTATVQWNNAATRAEEAEEALAAIKRVVDDAMRRNVKVSGTELGDEGLLLWISNRATSKPREGRLCR